MRDVDTDDPPDNLTADYDWSFETAEAPPRPPMAGFTVAGPVWIGEPAVFSNTSAGPGPLSFVWDFGDGSPSSTMTNPTHLYAAVGEYTVTLTVAGPTGTASHTGTVEVRPRVVYLGFIER